MLENEDLLIVNNICIYLYKYTRTLNYINLKKLICILNSLHLSEGIAGLHRKKVGDGTNSLISLYNKIFFLNLIF